MRILFLDIETSPNKVYVWGLWQQNVAPTQIIESSKVLCWAAKWHHEQRVRFESCQHGDERTMVMKMHALLVQADMVVHYHGSAFDMPTLNKEFLLYELAPPPPIRELDLLRVVRKRFRFPSNRLDYVCKRLGLGEKFEHEGQELWNKCLHGDRHAWATMKAYNQQDVRLLERLYHRLLPWIKTHLNWGVFRQSGLVCPNCGSAQAQRRGTATSLVGVYQRYQCTACGSWFRSSLNTRAKGERFVSL